MYVHSIAGIHRGLDLLDRAARRIADFENSDPARDQVDLIVGEHAVKANVAALKAQIDAGGALLDIFA